MTYLEWQKEVAEAREAEKRFEQQNATSHAVANSLLSRKNEIEGKAKRAYALGALSIEVWSYGADPRVVIMTKEGRSAATDSPLDAFIAASIVCGMIERWRRGGPELPPSGPFSMALVEAQAASIRRMLKVEP